MGLFEFLRRKDERAIPEPGTPEFEAAVQGSALPTSESGQTVSMGESGWSDPSQQTIDLRGTDAADQIRDTLRAHGIDPDKEGQTIDASTVPGLYKSIGSILGQVIQQAPGGGGITAHGPDPLAVIEELARKRDAGEITEAEFQAQKKQLLDQH
jgi:hypothetical protein